MTKHSAELKGKGGETIWIFRTEREQYFKMLTALPFAMCIASRGNVRGDKCAVVICGSDDGGRRAATLKATEER